VCNDGQKAFAARREVPDEAEFLHTVDDLHRGCLEDQPDPRPGLAQPRKDERGPEPTQGSYRGPPFRVQDLHPARF
jgi:hypothetical protein